MGYGYELKCKKCGHECQVYLGIGYCYPRVCSSILEAMKKGEFGKRFMKDAQNTPHAAVHQERGVFVCDHCGEWKSNATIDLCAPIGDPKKSDGRFCVAVEYPENIKYVMTCDIGREYKVIRSKLHRCGKCHHMMRPMKKNEKLKCPECGETLKKGNEINWD